jgi:hypothetical protein
MAVAVRQFSAILLRQDLGQLFDNRLGKPVGEKTVRPYFAEPMDSAVVPATRTWLAPKMGAW